MNDPDYHIESTHTYHVTVYWGKDPFEFFVELMECGSRFTVSSVRWKKRPDMYLQNKRIKQLKEDAVNKAIELQKDRYASIYVKYTPHQI